MAANARLTERKVLDLNADPTLPFPEGTFDTVRVYIYIYICIYIYK
jgi:hypothetical protein